MGQVDAVARLRAAQRRIEKLELDIADRWAQLSDQDHSLLRTGEAAALVGVTTQSIRNYVRSGRLRVAFAPMAYGWRFARADVNRLATEKRGRRAWPTSVAVA